jgi:hypothetical protein
VFARPPIPMCVITSIVVEARRMVAAVRTVRDTALKRLLNPPLARARMNVRLPLERSRVAPLPNVDVGKGNGQA